MLGTYEKFRPEFRFSTLGPSCRPPHRHKNRKGPATRFLRWILTYDCPTRRFGIDKPVQCIILIAI